MHLFSLRCQHMFGRGLTRMKKASAAESVVSSYAIFVSFTPTYSSGLNFHIHVLNYEVNYINQKVESSAYP